MSDDPGVNRYGQTFGEYKDIIEKRLREKLLDWQLALVHALMPVSEFFVGEFSVEDYLNCAFGMVQEDD